jgi:hypothetical protein
LYKHTTLEDALILRFKLSKKLCAIHPEYRVMDSNLLSKRHKNNTVDYESHNTTVKIKVPTELAQLPVLSIDLSTFKCFNKESCGLWYLDGVLDVSVTVSGENTICTTFGDKKRFHKYTETDLYLFILDTLIAWERMMPQRLPDVCDTNFGLQGLYNVFQNRGIDIVYIQQHFTHPKSKYLDLVEFCGRIGDERRLIKLCFTEHDTLVVRYLDANHRTLTNLSKSYDELDYDEIANTFIDVCMMTGGGQIDPR